MWTGTAMTIDAFGASIKSTQPRGATCLLKCRWSLADHAERLLQRDARPCDGALVEQSTEQRNAVWDAARRREFRQSIVRIRRPVAAGFRDFDEPRAQGERR